MASAARCLFGADQIGQRWDALERERDELEKEIVAYVRAQGSKPAKKPGMRVALGAEWELATIASGHYVILNAGKVRGFFSRCPRRLRERVIKRSVTFSILAGAAKALLNSDLSARTVKAFRAAIRLKKNKLRIRVTKLRPKLARKAIA